MDLPGDERSQDLGVARRVGELQIATHGVEQRWFRTMGLRCARGIVIEHGVLELVVELADDLDVHLEDEGRIRRSRDPRAHGQVVTDEEVLPGPERQALSSNGHLFPTLEDQAQNGVVHRGLERGRRLLGQEEEPRHQPSDLLPVACGLKVAMGSPDESFHGRPRPPALILDELGPARAEFSRSVEE